MAEAMENLEECEGEKIPETSHSKSQAVKEAILANHNFSQNESGVDTSICDGLLQTEVFDPDHTANNSNDLIMSIPKFDDSGIDFEKSPVSNSGKDSGLGPECSPSLKDCSMSELDLSESVSECVTDSGCTSRTNSECNSHANSEKRKTGKQNNIKLDHKADNSVKRNSASAAENNINKQPIPGEETDDVASEPGSSQVNDDHVHMETKNSDDDSDIVSFRKRPAKKRKYRFQRISDSDDDDVNQNEGENTEDQEEMADIETESDIDSDEFSDEEINDNLESVKSKSDDQKSNSEEEEEEDKATPKHTWFALKDLSSRQMGFSNKTPPSVFREKVQSSLQMVQRLKLQYKMEYHDGCVNALSFNRIGTLLASGSDDLNVILWNWIKKRPSLVYDSGHRGNVFQAKFMPFSGDCHVVSCARDGQVRLAELSLTGVCKGTKKLAQHKGAAHKLALELDSPHVFLSCGEDAVVYSIDLREDKPNKLCQTKCENRRVPLYSIHSNPVNSFEFCVGGRDRYIRIYDKRKISDSEDGIVKKFCPHHLIDSKSKADITCAVYNYNGREVMGSYNDDDIYLFDNTHSDGADFTRRYRGHRNSATVKGVNFYGPRSEFVVSGSDCGHVFLWDKETENVVQFMEGDDCGVINVLEPHPFAPIMATSGLDHDVKIWAPTADDPTVLPNLKKTTKKNRKERDEENSSDPSALHDMLDGPMMYYIMRQISRARRRNDPDGDDSSSNSSDSDSEDSEFGPVDRLQCAQQ
ncbi:DDB1- and CUL4-associated factor 8-like isoform X2 [Ostrea edulis]|uniref:DDB1- and CUL4-associated factor 8-like isoform X2 n=1 Tax=Ostrea edulis TaxID=37623 RepID=UPI0024AE9D54|nr:DDB1- and CUL4-associated factor 8-like isoform X2 [Ostrea edulis]XP_056011007.1 DDB1- and CUL4-associated factor 8-like isoform X2 [Ostrea edulis]